ncbi:hypothetical protein TNCV_263131 [Trichonephila clavipes]|nr:hypothetical protein TNCV_263131 [Trichonephila clavipes]
MSSRKHRSAFDQVSEFDRGRIVAYRDCGLSFRKIGSCVDGSLSHITNRSTALSVCNASFSVCATTDVSAVNGAIKEGCGWQNGMKLSLLTHLSAIPRWSDSSLETPRREDAEQLRYAPPPWFCTGYYGLRRVLDITLALL